jgi:hypothetical protein
MHNRINAVDYAFDGACGIPRVVVGNHHAFLDVDVNAVEPQIAANCVQAVGKTTNSCRGVERYGYAAAADGNKDFLPAVLEGADAGSGWNIAAASCKIVTVLTNHHESCYNNKKHERGEMKCQQENL